MIFEKIQLEEDEEIIAVVRRHWFYLVLHCVPIVILIIVPLITFSAFSTLEIVSMKLDLMNYLPHILFLYACWILCSWMLLATIWTDYYLNVWCVTNKRIVNVHQVGLFRRKIGSFRLERMQDVNVEINGVLATLLDYGTIHVQTASADMEEFKASFLPRPQEIKSVILGAGDKLIDRERAVLR